jgi:hypothetical protein
MAPAALTTTSRRPFSHEAIAGEDVAELVGGELHAPRDGGGAEQRVEHARVLGKAHAAGLYGNAQYEAYLESLRARADIEINSKNLETK